MTVVIVIASISLWIMFCIIIADVAGYRYDRSQFGWFLVAAIFSPIVAAGLLVMYGLKGKKCPRCDETIRLKAVICKYCRTKIS